MVDHRPILPVAPESPRVGTRCGDGRKGPAHGRARAHRARRRDVPLVRAGLVPVRPRRRRRARRDPGAAGHGLRRAGRPARRSPASTRRSPAWSATRCSGPSRVLVLGPDSSVSPLIFAAIMPLLVADDDPAQRDRARRDDGAARRAHRDRAGVGKLGFVADLLSKEVQVGYMNGLAITIIVGQLPKLFGFSTDADGFVDEVRAFVHGLDQRELDARSPSGSACWPCCSCCPAVTRSMPAVLVAVVGATVVSALFDLDDAATGRRAARRASHARRCRGPTWSDVGPLLVAAVGITLGVAHRHHRHRRRASPPAAATRSTRTRR